ncbi:unnamed protein product [Fasciola hepatica]|uniref:Uncharacterized protein n=1 Tax=Fasciola hepatica TaxID=6192 RepID=A0ABC9HIJ1_FASHE
MLMGDLVTHQSAWYCVIGMYTRITLGCSSDSQADLLAGRYEQPAQLGCFVQNAFILIYAVRRHTYLARCEELHDFIREKATQLPDDNGLNDLNDPHKWNYWTRPPQIIRF